MRRALTPVIAIRHKCRECGGNSTKKIRQCALESCPLHTYRLGRNPQRRGIGGKSKKKALTLPKEIICRITIG